MPTTETDGSTDARRVEVESLSKSFGDEAVLREVDLSVAPGEICVVVGPSGCGKSTLLKAIAGLVETDDGVVRFDGADAGDLSIPERDVALVFQEFEETLFPHMTVAENVAFGLRQREGVADAEIDERVDEMLDLLAISELRDDHPDELSGGQQQRVELARQLVRGCDVLLMDDPLADLDYKLQKRLQLELRRLHAEWGATVVYVTHNQDQALTLADTLAVLNDGTIEQVGAPAEVYDDPQTAFVGRFVGDANLAEGEYVGTEGETLLVETGAGRLAATSHAPPESAGVHSYVLVRPERIAVGEDAARKENVVEATLQGRTFTGEETEFAVDVAGIDEQFQIRVPGNVSVGAIGDRVTVGWDAVDARLFHDGTLSASGEYTPAQLRELFS